MLLRESGVADADLRAMACDNPASLFGIAAR
jgi:predicted metal-dependent phosphotriesterase family hydrolase